MDNGKGHDKEKISGHEYFYYKVKSNFYLFFVNSTNIKLRLLNRYDWIFKNEAFNKKFTAIRRDISFVFLIISLIE